VVDIILLLMAIASAISLLVVSPRDVQRKAILALREYEEMELSRAHGGREEGQAKAIPIATTPADAFSPDSAYRPAISAKR
jgi:hypothetical protein